MTPVILESALRTAAMAATAWAGLRLLRITHVAAQKFAWTLVLLAGVAMPLLMRWQAFPLRPALVLPSITLPSIAHPSNGVPPTVLPSIAQPANHVGQTPPARSASLTVRSSPPSRRNAAPITTRTTKPAAGPDPLTRLRRLVRRIYLPIYLTVCLVLALRLLLSLALSADIWRRARPVWLAAAPELHAQARTRVRVSSEISGPVTIGSAILLPSSFTAWDSAKLRIVLAHEGAHVRQGDFYLQVLARLHSAVFWFSPVAWWLQQELSDLGEAVSDRAALEQAPDPPSYAEVLLEFAAGPRPVAGVAMARSTSNLQQRIDRLLTDRLFRSAFMQGRKHVSLAAAIVPVALVLSTSLVTVRAAQGVKAVNAATAQASPPPPPAAAPAPPSSVATPAQPEPAPAPTPEVNQAPAPQAPASPKPGPPAPAAAPSAPASPAAPASAAPASAAPEEANAPSSLQGKEPPASDEDSFAFVTRDQFDFDDQQSFVLVDDGQSHSVFINGDSHALDSYKTKVRGNSILFERDGKAYVIDDPALVRQSKQMMQPIEDLGRQQQALAAQQEALGKQEEALGRQQEQTSVPTPDMSKEIAELQTAMQKLQDLQKSQTLRPEDLAGIQGQLGGLQGRLGLIEAQLGAQQGRFGAQQGALGAQQGRLGAQQGRLGAQQARLSQEVSRKMKALIEQAVRDGKAKPVK